MITGPASMTTIGKWKNFCPTATNNRRAPLQASQVETLLAACRESEADLRRSLDGYTALFQKIPVPIAVTRFYDGRFVDVNELFCHETGYIREEIIGRTALEMNFYPHPEQRKRLIHLILQSGSVDSMEMTFRIKSGADRTVKLTARSLRLDNKEHLLSVVNDDHCLLYTSPSPRD